MHSKDFNCMWIGRGKFRRLRHLHFFCDGRSCVKGNKGRVLPTMVPEPAVVVSG